MRKYQIKPAGNQKNLRDQAVSIQSDQTNPSLLG